MLDAPVGLALAAGTLAAVNPCGFALLPAYLGLLVRGEAGTENPGRTAAVGRALAAAGAMTFGFAVVFGAFGLVVAPVAGSVQRHLPWFTIVLGVLVLAIGGWLLTGRSVTIPGIRLGGPAVRRTVPSMALFGGAYAVASLGCTIAPFLATVVVTFRSGSVAAGMVTFLAYAGGMGLAVAAAALAVALSRESAARRLRRWGPAFTRVGGGLLAAAGAYVAYYGWYEIRVLNGGATGDPVVGAAEAVQRWLATSVEALGAAGLALLVLVMALVTVALATGHRLRLRRSARLGAVAGQAGADRRDGSSAEHPRRRGRLDGPDGVRRRAHDRAVAERRPAGRQDRRPDHPESEPPHGDDDQQPRTVDPVDPVAHQ